MTVDRLRAVDWQAVTAALDAGGTALVPGLLSATDCERLRALHDAA